MAEESNPIGDFFEGLTNLAQGVASPLIDFQTFKLDRKFLIANAEAERERILNQRAPETQVVRSVGFGQKDILIVVGIGAAVVAGLFLVSRIGK